MVPHTKTRAMRISTMASVVAFPPNWKFKLPNHKSLIAAMAPTAKVPPSQSGEPPSGSRFPAPPLLQPPPDTPFLPLPPRLIIPPPIQTLRQVLLKLHGWWSLRVLDLQILVMVVRILIGFAIIKVLHQLRRRIADL